MAIRIVEGMPKRLPAVPQLFPDSDQYKYTNTTHSEECPTTCLTSPEPQIPSLSPFRQPSDNSSPEKICESHSTGKFYISFPCS